MHKIQTTNAVSLFQPLAPSPNTYSNELVKFLWTLAQSHLPSTCTVSDSSSFLQELNTFDVSSKCMISFDVVSFVYKCTF